MPVKRSFSAKRIKIRASQNTQPFSKKWLAAGALAAYSTFGILQAQEVASAQPPVKKEDTPAGAAATTNTQPIREEERIRVEVTDTIPTPSNSRLGTANLRDIPQTISIIPHTVIEQQGATSLRDVLRNVPGLTMTAGEGGTSAGDNLTLRGNSARNDIFIDGSRDLSSQSRDPFNMEQVEVTKGPTSATTGRGSAGGTINLSSKSPSLMHSIGGSFAFGNADTRRATMDMNTPVKPLGEHSAFRLNLLWHDGGVPGRQVVNNSRWGIAPSLAFGLGTKNRVTLQYYKVKQQNISDYGIPWVTATNNALLAYRDKPAPVPRDTFYGFKDRDQEYLNQDSATVRFEHDFNDNVSFRNQLRYGRAGRNSIATPPRFNSDATTVINREMRAWLAQDRILDNQSDLNARFKTGFIEHRANIGSAFTRETNIRQTVATAGTTTTTTLLNPNPNDVYTGPYPLSPNIGNLVGNTQAAWAFDNLRMANGKIEALGGARWERFDVNGVSTTPAPVTQLVKMTSIRSALTYHPIRSMSVYGSYGTSMSPSLDGLSYSTSNTAIPPEKTKNLEFGAKADLLNARILATGAVFRIAKDNARTPGLLPTDPPQVLAGTQVSRGIEGSLSGAVTRQLRILGSYTFIDARIGKSNTAAEVGKFFQNTPKHSASVWATYTAKRFSLGLGPRYMSKRYGNNTNTRVVDGYWTVDAMVGATINEHFDLRLNLTNLSNTYYFDRLGGGHVIPGAARGVLLSTNFRF